MDLKGRPWWCPGIKATDTEEIKRLRTELTDRYWNAYPGPWNINPGADNDQD